MSRIWQVLRSPRLALGVLAFLAAYCALAAWYPGRGAAAGTVPSWAAFLHLDHPFSSPAFLAAVALLFLSTGVCTWDRTERVAAIFRGRLRPYALELPTRPGTDLAAFLRARGFGRPNAAGVAYRSRPALWGGWLLHLGLLSLIAGVFVQQGFRDGGAFELAEGETLRLDAPGSVFGRERGPLAPDSPPALRVGLVAFDPFLHLPGYEPDRASRLSLRAEGAAATETVMDRAAGAEIRGTTIYQAIPSGLALVVELPGRGAHALHLHQESPQVSTGTFDSPAGHAVRFGAETERRLDDRAGTGAIAMWCQSSAGKKKIAVGEVFDFAGTPARLAGVVRWAGFTYSVNPGMPAVFVGFGLVLLGATLLALPAGVAETNSGGTEPAAWVYVTRGREELLADWLRADSTATPAVAKGVV